MDNIYGYSYYNAGLGNMIWSWANCYIWCKDNRVKMVAPTWGFPHYRMWIKERRIDRWYGGYFSNDGYISGFQRQRLLAQCKKINFSDIPADINELSRLKNGRPTMITFTRLYDFELLVGRHREVLQELTRITRKKYLPQPEQEPFIAVHVRLGDFHSAATQPTETIAPNTRIPLQWYILALRKIRSQLGWNLRAIVFSDGSDSELSALLEEPNVTRSTGKNAIGEIWTMIESAAIIASRSSFSLWGTYLGQTPTIYHPGGRPCSTSVVGGCGDFELEPEWQECAELSECFMQSFRNKLNNELPHIG